MKLEVQSISNVKK